MYKKLKKIRYGKSITSKEVAERIGLSKAFYCQLENRKRRLSYEMAVKISQIFDLKPDELFYDETLKSINDENIKK